MTMTFIPHKWSLWLLIVLAALTPGCRSKSVGDTPGSDSTSAVVSPSPAPGATSNGITSETEPDIASIDPESTAADSQTSGQVEPPANCNNLQTQLEMNLCTKAWFEEEDNKLNQYFQDLKASLSSEKQADLTAAELAWLDFRDANCDFEASQVEGGSMQPTVYFNCLAEMTRDRTLELQQPTPISLSYERADQQLNQLYQTFQSILTDQNLEALTNTQLYWISYRDANCAYETGNVNDCLARVTQERTQQLEEQLSIWQL
ncbi:MAG: lysozyme inhibitor LprI family protein [Leptolyngbyaceae cyanobacterium MO_188.B28]|nr:lysozyme inhibitor LprI family protein [Leptolyngbyaceae cyanobacterium MO_188.B28]